MGLSPINPHLRGLTESAAMTRAARERRAGRATILVLMQFSLLCPVRLRRTPRFSAFRLVTLLCVGLLLPLLGRAQSTISGASTVKGTVGVPLTYQIVASGNVTSYSASTLPGGLTLNSNTGLIVGVPTVAASVDVVVRANT